MSVLDRIPTVFRGARRDAVLIDRLDRRDEGLWSRTRSCLGGLPSLGDRPWPFAGATWQAGGMHCLAQIDLGELGRTMSLPGGHGDGTLVFFANTDFEGGAAGAKVLHVQSDTQTAPTDPPKRTQPLYGQEDWRYHHPGSPFQSAAPRVFPRWPIRFLGSSELDALHLVPDRKAWTRIVDDLIGPEPDGIHFPFDACFGPDAGGGRPDPRLDAFPVRTLQILIGAMLQSADKALPLQTLPQAMDRAAHQTAFDTLTGKVSDQAPFRRLAADWLDALDAVDWWSPIGDARATRFHQDFGPWMQRGASTAPNLGAGVTPIVDAATRAYRAMASGPRPAFDAIPDALRKHIQTQRRRSGWEGDQAHAILGPAHGVQQAPRENQARHLLLQLASDDMVDFLWGDVGVLQFWIDDADLIAGNWDGVDMTMEGH